MNDDYVSRMVRRRVGLDALRRLRRRDDDDPPREAGEARLARRLAMAIAVLAGLTLLFFLLR